MTKVKKAKAKEARFKPDIQLDRAIVAAHDIGGFRGVAACEKSVGLGLGVAHARLAWFRQQSADYQNKVRAANAAEKEGNYVLDKAEEIG